MAFRLFQLSVVAQVFDNTSRLLSNRRRALHPGVYSARPQRFRMKVGGHTIVIPKSLATNLPPKDQRKLPALFKRIVKRGKKRAATKRATKKR